MRFERMIWPFFIGLLMAACDGDGTTGTGGTGGNTGGTGGASTAGNGGTGGETSSGGTGGTSTGGTGGSTGGTGGTSTGGTGGTGGSTGGSGGTGGGSGSACQWKIDDPCGAGFYCKAAGCGMGTCEPIGTIEQDARMPVCGCDGVTYWNDSIAGSHGMAVSSAGECGPAATQQCGGFGGLTCPAGASCNYELLNQAQCNIADIGGTCWAVPKVCGGGIGFGPNTRECGAPVCKSECELIKSEVPWYLDNTCPQ